ncbi:hypothetical protein CAOG_03217 [Capsaspora owczarzaki ATCC 30864]|uniref:Uncharacterized protein n=1 Tax=Capsaspora owczarzaki (strain ATCC 30864) TaxID=595528 RepID=A0A0D2X2A2_CAPO3|nr:hypothetical protein CAOG_03217 [Capsaspora owczarzaki ATCC 30864]KJE92204.1 hypothetical protein CAOG_003217 [Capsaspora owczarzaki ATCC 30864]|eukprot:XP_004364056.1 hypothetical protein CAOG_03217 [Capsaspora owczarzaki ATCC 30864]
MTLPTPASSLSSAPLLPDHEPSLQASPSPRKSANPSANPSPLQQLLAAPDKLGLQSPPLPSPPSQVDMLSTSDMVVMANSSLDSTALATSEGDNHSLVAATAAGPTSPWLTPPQDSASSLLDSTSSNTDGNALSNPSQSSSNSSSSNNSSSSSHSNNGQNGSNPNGSITSSSSSSSSSNSSDSAAGSASSSSNSSPPMEASASALSVLDGLLGVNPLAEPSISELSAALSADAAHLLPPIGEGPLNLSSLLADDSAPLDASALPLAAGDMLGALLTAPADEADPLASFLGTASTSVADDDAASLTTSSALLSAAATGLEANSANAGTDSLEDIMFSIMDETVGGPPSALDAAMLGVEGSLASSTADFLAAAAQYAAVTAASAPPPMFGGPCYDYYWALPTPV